MRLTKKVFTDLAIYMIGFGLIIGIIFPIFTRLIGIPSMYIDVVFIISCLLAGLTVGVVNIVLAKLIVGRRIKNLSSRMKYVNQNLKSSQDLDIEACLERCMIPVDSEDELGESSESFNSLVKSFLSTLGSESSIRNFTEIFTNELDLEKLSEKALNYLVSYTHSTAGIVLIDKGGEIEVSFSSLIKNPEEIVNLEVVHKCFSNNERVIFDFSDDIVIQAGLIDFQPKSIMVEPISYKNDVLGVIMLASTKDFSEQMLEELNVYTHGLSLGMHNAIIHDKLEQLAILDPLTKTYNRRFGMGRLKEDFSRTLRNNEPLGILMLDVDFFKKVNDTYGHIVGDHVLVNVANAIKNNIRKGDVLVRYGGEEFMVIMPGAKQEGLKIAGEKIRRIVEENATKHNNQEIKVTISIGGSSYPELEVKEVEQLVNKADENLYSSKDTGRNKVTVK